MDNSSKYFYISGFIAFTLFAIVAFLFMFMFFRDNSIKSYSMKKENYLSVSLQTIDIKPKKKQIKKEAKQVVQTPDEPMSEDVNVDDLFSDVWTKKISSKKVKPKPKINPKRYNEIAQKFHKSKTNTTKNISEDILDVKNIQPDDANKESSSSDEVNEYLAKIQALVYKYFFPPANSQGHQVKVVIELSALGKVLDFRILQYSSNLLLNQECDKIKDRLKGVIFPKNPNNKSGRYTVILISKE